jgi:integrase
MFASAKNYRGSIMIDYVFDRNHLRVSTGITKISQSDFKNGNVGAKVLDHENKNTIIKIKLKQVNSIIDDYFIVNKQRPSINYLKNKLSEEKQNVEIKHESFADYYTEFYNSKSLEAIVIDSLKDYKSLKNALLTYDAEVQRLTFEIINSADFFVKFEKFLSDPSPSKEFKFRGNQSNNTIRKRISCLSTFLKWCESKDYIKRKFEVENYVSKVKKFKPTIVILTKEEQIKLKELELTGDEEKIRDIMLFLCYTGLRYSDLLTLGKGDCRGGFISKDAEKTRFRFKVPLNKNSTDLLEKYNYNFNIFSTTIFNLLIKKLLKNNDICSNTVEIRDVKYNKIIRTKVIKRTEISSHTGRRSFVAKCIQNGFGLTDIMGFTGHKKVDTLLIYVDVFQNQESAVEKFKLLEL